jgi:predicted small lipoprotein YifL/LysM repeat protein
VSVRSKFSVLLALAVLAAGAGCGSDNGPLGPETDEPLYRQGQQYEKQGRNEEALNAYLKLITRRGDQAPQAHLEAGILYLDTFRDPISAIYHFQQYLKLLPNSVQAGFVRGQIDAAKREFASTLPAASWQMTPATPGTAGADLQSELQQLQAENAALRAQLAELRSSAANGVTVQPAPEPAPAASAPVAIVPVAPVTEAPAPSPPAAAPNRPAPAGRVYVVEPGDGLMKVARKMYGSESRWRDIVSANPELFPNGRNTRLHPGMRLKIP